MQFAKTLSVVFLFWGNIYVFGFFKDDQRLPCALKWVSYSVGSEMPSKIIYSHAAGTTSQQAVARLFNEESGKYVAGLYDVTNMEGIFPIRSDNGTTLATFFEVATNQFDCELDWNSDWRNYPRKEFFVPVGSGQEFVGRMMHKNNLYSGHVISGTISISPNASEPIVTGTNFQMLISHNDGLELSLTNIILDEEPYSGIDFAGHDIIQNDAHVAINQTVTHSKIFRETFRYTLTETWTSTYTSRVRKWFKTRTETTTKTNTKSTTTETFQEREVKVSSQVLVPLETSAEVCSVISIAKDFTTAYSATARYNAKGMTVFDLQKVLERDGITDTYVENEDVVLSEPYRGDLTISIAMDTKFIVSALGDVDGCYGTKKIVAAEKKGFFEKKILSS